MKSAVAEAVSFVVVRRVIWLRVERSAPQPIFPRGKPKSWQYCEQGCIHQFSGERICHECSNWEILPVG